MFDPTAESDHEFSTSKYLSTLNNIRAVQFTLLSVLSQQNRFHHVGQDRIYYSKHRVAFLGPHNCELIDSRHDESIFHSADSVLLLQEILVISKFIFCNISI